jgi:hypothetical protein
MKFFACVCMLLLATAAFAKEGVRICETCIDIDATINPTPAYQTIAGTTIGQPNSEYTYQFCAEQGGTYTFTFCHDGGSATYDSGLSIQGPTDCGVYLACNDDWCSLQSELVWTAPQHADYLIVVDGYSSNTGTYVLAYAGPECIVPAATSTWSTVKALY